MNENYAFWRHYGMSLETPRGAADVNDLAPFLRATQNQCKQTPTFPPFLYYRPTTSSNALKLLPKSDQNPGNSQPKPMEHEKTQIVNQDEMTRI